MTDHSKQPILVDAQPVRRHGDAAVWDAADIPHGVQRSFVTESPDLADLRCFEVLHSAAHGLSRDRFFAAVRWSDLQPRQQPVLTLPDGRFVQIEDWIDDMRKPATQPILVDAEPIQKAGEIAVWHVDDVPIATPRLMVGTTVAEVLEASRFFLRRQRNPKPFVGGLDHARGRGLCVGVRWCDLQPRRPVPRGRETMTAAQWGVDRDEHGVCCVCGADDSMWCDSEINHLAASGRPSPRDRPVRTYPANPLSASLGEDCDRSTISSLQRAAWAAELRAKVEASARADRERERLRVLVDIQDLE